jgi:hypothetical protein
LHRSERAEINAAPNLLQFWNFGTTPGTYVVAVPPTTEPAALLARFSFSGSCTNGGVRPFENDRFVGQQQSRLDCGGATLRFVNIAARARDKTFTMFLQVGQPIADDEELNRIVASAGAAPGAVFPPPSLSVPLKPTGSVPPELLVAPAMPTTPVVDDTGRLSMRGADDVARNGRLHEHERRRHGPTSPHGVVGCRPGRTATAP